MKKTVIISIAIWLCSCSNIDEKRLNYALDAAKDNRAEIVKVLEHYEPNSQKYKAARFLIENMPFNTFVDQYFLSPEGERYRPKVVFDGHEIIKKHCDSLLSMGYVARRKMKYDIVTLTSEYIINNIELAFSVWQKPWNKDLSFEDFCRYVLPYRAQSEIPTGIRKKLMERFLPILEEAKVTNIVEAYSLINDLLPSYISYGPSPVHNFYPMIEETEATRRSRCEGMCNYGVMIMRSVGLPCVAEITTWTKMDLGHNWCAIVYDDKIFPFTTGEAKHQSWYDLHVNTDVRYRIPVKVYRKTFFLNESEFKQENDNYATYLKSPLFQDVTNDYPNENFNFSVAHNKEDVKNGGFAYLCSYNLYDWKPLALGSIKGDSCVFNDVVGDNIFRVADSPDGSYLRFLTPPFQLNAKGEIHRFIPDLTKKCSYTATNNIDTRMLHYWNTDQERFIKIDADLRTDTTKVYNNIPSNALLWYAKEGRTLNQRIFYLNKDGSITQF